MDLIRNIFLIDIGAHRKIPWKKLRRFNKRSFFYYMKFDYEEIRRKKYLCETNQALCKLFIMYIHTYIVKQAIFMQNTIVVCKKKE